jgi:uncharacterized protein (TIGR00255 family)
MGFRAELSSVNRKQFELKVNLPREISFYEPKLRMMVSERANRGAILLRVDLERCDVEAHGRPGVPLTINESSIVEILARCERIKNRHGIPGQVDLGVLLSLPGVIEPLTPDYSLPAIEALLRKAVDEAIDRMLDMRETEGVNLREDLDGRIQNLSELLDAIEPMARIAPDSQRERLHQRLRDAGLPAEYDDDRLLRELVIFADRADVSEEITRLRSHFSHFKKFLDKGSEPIGRSLDFMVQEICREVTTLGNKTPSPELSPLVVQFKTELEKIREQVQNVE